MPICHVSGCLFHNLDLRAGHKCIKCKKEVHTLCAHHLEDQPTDSNLVCFACFPPGSTITPAIQYELLQTCIQRPPSQQQEQDEDTNAKTCSPTEKKTAPTIEKKRKGDGHEEDVQLRAKKKCSPIAVQHLMENRNQRMGFGCQVCTFEGRGRGTTRNVVVCATHRLRLCTVSQPTKQLLQEKGPKEGEEMIDYSWRAPNTEWTCWEKAHKFYIPQGLFRNMVPKLNGSNVSFQCAVVSSQLYNAKRLALGEEVVKRGRTSGRKNKQTKNQNKRKAGKPKKQPNNRSARNDNNGEDDDSEAEKEDNIPEEEIILGEVDREDVGADTDDDDDFDWNAIESDPV
jgi:hypothetical protein